MQFLVLNIMINVFILDRLHLFLKDFTFITKNTDESLETNVIETKKVIQILICLT